MKKKIERKMSITLTEYEAQTAIAEYIERKTNIVVPRNFGKPTAETKAEYLKKKRKKKKSGMTAPLGRIGQEEPDPVSIMTEEQQWTDITHVDLHHEKKEVIVDIWIVIHPPEIKEEKILTPEEQATHDHNEVLRTTGIRLNADFNEEDDE
jgi:hypothetical protein